MAVSSAHSVGELIQKLRKEQRFSQQDLANKMQVSKTAIARWEQGKFEPTASNIESLAMVFGKPVDVFKGMYNKAHIEQINANYHQMSPKNKALFLELSDALAMNY